MTHAEFTPRTRTELAEFVRANAEGKREPLVPVGGGTGLAFACDNGTRVNTAGLNRTIDYPARDMTITVEAGMRIAELAAILAKENQQLPIDVPQADTATVGGAVASSPSGPRRFGYGTLRDYVIGISAVDAGGREFKAGGRVVKNVAGYDLCKLMIGSLGTLAIVTQVTFKLKPKPPALGFLQLAWADFAAFDSALERLTDSDTRPIVLDALNPAGMQRVGRSEQPDLPALLVGFDGTQQEVDWQIAMAQEELRDTSPQSVEKLAGDDAAKWLAAATGFPVTDDTLLTFKASLLPSKTMEFLREASSCGASLMTHAGNGIVVGHLPHDVTSSENADEAISRLRRIARDSHGNLTILACHSDQTDSIALFGEAEASWPLAYRVKESLDPHGLLNPGRFVDAITA